ncbi:MaoC family dehydratase N-terminal domain-containing protein [Lipingzhangella sp. LS1_29]|uniref:UPF0336 protein RIF23_06680 n=1 Tax=Lipingzhangella rawalii TaxID=2055835 RepID=A0ABU2H3U9_9ACTN|nr:MaoC family dehydratase N-terminal domain-containing protein [Lipingzhangella rawalii]MDS1269978.1 MaoC family dehydratase N-terminal domain-containing protein [Lipingzhangella rawalii]
MAINQQLTGRVYPAPHPYEVTRGKIREFTTAIGDANPLYLDRAAAVEAGYPDVIAPPTFPIIVDMEAVGQAVVDPELNLDFARVVHAGQQFRYSRPLRAGDRVSTVTRIADIKALGRNEVITFESEITDEAGAHVVTAVNTLAVRGAGD